MLSSHRNKIVVPRSARFYLLTDNNYNFIINADCARDTAVYFPERGMTVSEVCQENGNYRPYQQAGDRYYCVDTDGYMTSEGLMDELPDPDYCSRYA